MIFSTHCETETTKKRKGFPTFLPMINNKMEGKPCVFRCTTKSARFSYKICDFFLVGKPTISNYHSTISLVFLAQSRGFSPCVFPPLPTKKTLWNCCFDDHVTCTHWIYGCACFLGNDSIISKVRVDWR